MEEEIADESKTGDPYLDDYADAGLPSLSRFYADSPS